MVKEENWLSKPGSKWKTMPELMFHYRAAAFFGRLYASDILMGMHTVEEIQDIPHATIMESEISKAELEQLYHEKRALLSDSDLANILRIIEDNEVNSFRKALDFLKTL
jgi:hypothetical protein